MSQLLAMPDARWLIMAVIAPRDWYTTSYPLWHHFPGTLVRVGIMKVETHYHVIMSQKLARARIHSLCAAAMVNTTIYSHMFHIKLVFYQSFPRDLSPMVDPRVVPSRSKKRREQRLL
jgi:hypothetical protein